jgi:hypothetical protein
MALPPMRKQLFPALAAALAAGAALALLRRGVVMGPDSWAYWEGSVSLLERSTYTYFGGQRVYAFPPLFALWLAGVQAVLGVSARTLIVAQVFLAACAAWRWQRLYQLTAGAERSWIADGLAALFIAATLAVSAQTLLSEALWLALLPVALRLALEHGTGRHPASDALRLGLTVLALLLCRNVTVALLPAVLLLAVLATPREQRARRAAAVAVAQGGAAVGWLAVRHALGQSSAHAVGTGQASLAALAGQTLAGLAEALGPARFHAGALLLAAAAAVCATAWLRKDDAGRLVAFAALGLAGQAALFALTYVAEPIRGRFLVFAALLVAIAVLSAARTDGGFPGRAALAVGAAITAVAVLRVGVKVRLAGVEQPAVGWRTTVSSRYWSGPPQPRGALVLTAPPSYPWIDRPVDGGGTAP